MNVGLLLIILLLILSFLGIPISFSLGISSLVAILFGDMPLLVIPQKLFTGMDSVPLLAIPFFLLAGNLMACGITQKILDLSNAMLGAVKGSLAIVTVIASAIFAAITGSGVATVSAIGGITIPAMIKEKYPPAFAATISGISSTLGPLIPPSIFLIVYGAATETSIAQLFAASFLPGIFLAIVLTIYAIIYARKHDFPSKEKASLQTKLKVLKEGSWAIFMPVLILGGIFLGIFTATEAAAVSAGYAAIVGLLIYKTIKFKDIPSILVDSAVVSATVLLLLGLSKVSSWVIVTSQLPTMILNAFQSFTSSPMVILMLLNILLLMVGMIMEGTAAIVMLTPLLIPLLKAYGISTMHFGVVMSMNLCLGLVTPPVGSCILLANEIAHEKLDKTLKVVMTPLLISILVLLAVTYIPALTLWLPGVMF